MFPAVLPLAASLAAVAAKTAIVLLAAVTACYLALRMLQARRPVTVPDLRRGVSPQAAAKEALDEGRLGDACDLLVRAGNHTDAARVALRMHDMRRAAMLFSRAAAYEESANCFLKCGEAKQAAEALLSGGMHEKAAALLRQTGDLKGAASAYLKAGRNDLAAQVVKEAGDPADVHRMWAEVCLRNNDLHTAGLHFERCGRLDAAADCYERAGQDVQAARLLASMGQQARAARLYERNGEFLEAAKLFASADDLQSAVRCFKLAGRAELGAAVLGERGFAVEAAQIFLTLGLADDGLRALASVPEEAVQFPQACLLTARTHAERGDHQGAAAGYENYLRLGERAEFRAEALRELSFIHEALGSPERALRCLTALHTLGRAEDEDQRRIEALRKDLFAAQPPESLRDPNATLTSPATIGTRYQFLRRIGQGSHGVIYLVRDVKLNRKVVLKFMKIPSDPNDRTRRYFMREAQALAGLEHPNIVKVFDTGEMNGQLFLSLEYVRGISLEDLLERTQQPLGFSFVLSVARQLASALDHAHSRGIIHRDVKPENVMIDRRGMIKLTDFGLAKPIEELSKGRTIVCGTPYYMSPEQIEGRDFDHRTDIYALGVTLFRLFSGKLPFTEGNIFAQHSFCEPPDPCTINPAVPRAAGDAILKCLAKKPDDRPASALQVYELVENAISG